MFDMSLWPVNEFSFAMTLILLMDMTSLMHFKRDRKWRVNSRMLCMFVIYPP